MQQNKCRSLEQTEADARGNCDGDGVESPHKCVAEKLPCAIQEAIAGNYVRQFRRDSIRQACARERNPSDVDPPGAKRNARKCAIDNYRSLCRCRGSYVRRTRLGSAHIWKFGF
eukprot:GEMP01047852.1.p3 GENE.GEMP01047852.1~~GEMP01047852.1.p3  ORF type:complete len:114 (+),score=22.59 GEMP01047852.1:699-1040(+)